MKKDNPLKRILDEIEKNPNMKLLPPQVRENIRESLKDVTRVNFPIITLKEGGWFVAHTPLIDVSAQGKTEEDAVENLKAMIDDYMKDSDTEKPSVKTIVKMEIGLKEIPMKLPIYPGDNSVRENTPITAR